VLLTVPRRREPLIIGEDGRTARSGSRRPDEPRCTVSLCLTSLTDRSRLSPDERPLGGRSLVGL
jgi:hypothetical protein